MNSFEQNDKIQQELAQTIQNLQLIVDKKHSFSTIEKDLLLQCLRNLYLLTLKYEPQDTIASEINAEEKTMAAPISKPIEKETLTTAEPQSKKNSVTEKVAAFFSKDSSHKEESAAPPTAMFEPHIEELTELKFPTEPAMEEDVEAAVQEDPTLEVPEETKPVHATTIPEKVDVAAQKAEPASLKKTEEIINFVANKPAQQAPSLFEEAEMQQTAQPAPQQRSLNDLLNEQKKDNSLADKLRQSKVEDLSKAISLNDKFLYIKELFKNKGNEFGNAIQTLNKCETWEDATDELELLKKYYAWEEDSPAYISFCDLVKRKFI